jgi:hypothetical protein
MSNREARTVNDEHGGKVRVSLGDPVWDGRVVVNPGVQLTSLWFGRRRVIARYYSQWQDRRHPGCCIGDFYNEVTEPTEVLRLCDLAGIEPPSFVPVQREV